MDVIKREKSKRIAEKKDTAKRKREEFAVPTNVVPEVKRAKLVNTKPAATKKGIVGSETGK